MNPDNFNMSEQELNAQRRRRAENFKLNIDESEYEDDNFVKSEDEPSNLNLDCLGFNCRSNGGCVYDNRHERFACREQNRLLNREN